MEDQVYAPFLFRLPVIKDACLPVIEALPAWLAHRKRGRRNGSRGQNRVVQQGFDMARLELENVEFAGLGAGANADILFEMGLACATGRDGETDLIAAHGKPSSFDKLRMR